MVGGTDRHGNFQLDRQPQGLCLLPIPSCGACQDMRGSRRCRHSSALRAVYDRRLLCYGLAPAAAVPGHLSGDGCPDAFFLPRRRAAGQGVGRAPRWLVLRGALGQVLGKLSQAANGAGLHASGRQGSQDGVTDSRKGLEGVRAGVRVGQPSHKRLVDVKDQRLGLG